MKTLQDIRGKQKDATPKAVKPSQQPSNPQSREPPPVLVLKRKGIRVFPEGQRIALYYSDELNKVIAIPYAGVAATGEQE